MISLRDQLLKEHSAENRDYIVAWVGKSPERTKQLVELMIQDESYRVSQRAAWPLMHLANKEPLLIRPFIVQIIDNLENAKHDAVIRNTIRILQDQVIPEEKEGQLYEKCFEYLSSMKQPIAIKVFAMTVLSNIASKFPELAHELIAEIEYQYPHGSKGFQSRGRKILKKLKKLE